MKGKAREDRGRPDLDLLRKSKTQFYVGAEYWPRSSILARKGPCRVYWSGAHKPGTVVKFDRGAYQVQPSGALVKVGE